MNNYEYLRDELDCPIMVRFGHEILDLWPDDDIGEPEVWIFNTGEFEIGVYNEHNATVVSIEVSKRPDVGIIATWIVVYNDGSINCDSGQFDCSNSDRIEAGVNELHSSYIVRQKHAC